MVKKSEDYKDLIGATFESFDLFNNPYCSSAFRVGEFDKVSVAQFEESMQEFLDDNVDKLLPEYYGMIKKEIIDTTYKNIVRPTRATSGSAGYDFCSPIGFKLSPKETIKIPTGICVKISDGWFLGCLPRSGLGFKYKLQLDNTMGIIDAKVA